MDFKEILKNRKSIRKFKDTPVEKEKVEQLLAALAGAPSSSNRQEWKFVAVQDPAVIAKLREAGFGRPPLATAPLIFCICSTENESLNNGGLNRGTIDGAIASTYLYLASWDLGLGSCWVGSFDQQIAVDAIGCPEGTKIISLFAVGYADEDPALKSRKSVEDVAVYDRF